MNLDLVDEVEAGDYRDIDSYVEELREAGLEADYRNVFDSGIDFIAILTVEGEEHAVFQSDVFGHNVRGRKPLQHIV